MKISILLPVFNTAPYLSECLDSIIAQTETDWELLAVDNFSTDHSAEILEKYARLDGRIVFLSKNNLSGNVNTGILPALRLAFRKSSGQLITRMDSDDRMALQKLASLRKILLENGPGHVATGQIEFFSEQEIRDGFNRYAVWLNGLAQNGGHAVEIYKENVVPSPCWMVWRSDLESCGAFQNEVYPEDYDLVFRWRHAGLKILASPETLHLWRERPDRTSRTDERYRDNAYLELKIHWFLKIDHQPERPLVLWGAGKKGKRLAALLADAGIPFRWVCENPKKVGLYIYNIELEKSGVVAGLVDPQIIVAVAAPDGQLEILDFMDRHHFEAGKHFFFFC